MKLLHTQELALLSTLRAEREASDERAREQRLAEARRWEEYLFTTFDQLTARLPHPRAGDDQSRQHPGSPSRRKAA